MAFKVGDRVRRIQGEDPAVGMHLGKVYCVADIHPRTKNIGFNNVINSLSGKMMFWHPDRFELVNENE